MLYLNLEQWRIEMVRVSVFLQSPALVELLPPGEIETVSQLTKLESDWFLGELAVNTLLLALRENHDTMGGLFAVGLSRYTPNTRMLLAANTIKLHAQPA